MKYTIEGFQQEKLVEIGLNGHDAILLRVLKNMYSASTIEFILEDGDKYIWVNQTYLHKQVPILGTKRTISNMLDKLESKNCIQRILKHQKGGVRGNFSYIRLTRVTDSLEEMTPYEKSSEGCEEVSKALLKKVQNKDSSSVLDNTRLSPTEVEQEEEENLKKKDLDKIIAKWNDNTKGKIRPIRAINRNTNRYKQLNARYKESSLAEVLEGIENISKSKFLQGYNDRGWVIDFDWYIKPSNFIKVLEGNFTDTKPAKVTPKRDFTFTGEGY